MYLFGQKSITEGLELEGTLRIIYFQLIGTSSTRQGLVYYTKLHAKNIFKNYQKVVHSLCFSAVSYLRF